jgi:hypothetical protein
VEFAPAADLPSVLACNAGSVASGACCFERAAPADGGVPDEVSAGDLTLKDNGDLLTTLTFGAQGHDIRASALGRHRERRRFVLARETERSLAGDAQQAELGPLQAGILEKLLEACAVHAFDVYRFGDFRDRIRACSPFIWPDGATR